MAEPKKQIPLRLNAKLYDALAAWAEDDFRSVNGQIEYLLTECVRGCSSTCGTDADRIERSIENNKKQPSPSLLRNATSPEGRGYAAFIPGQR